MRFEAVIIGKPDDAVAAQTAVDAVVAALPEGWQTVSAPWRKSLSGAGSDLRIKVVGRTVDRAAAEAAWAVLEPAIPEGFRAIAADYEQDFAAAPKAAWAAQVAAEATKTKDETNRLAAAKLYESLDKNATLNLADKAAVEALVADATGVAKPEPEPIGEVEK